MSSPALTRKRSRAQRSPDELSPEKDHTPLSTAKRKKLNVTSTERPQPDLLRSLGRVAGRALGCPGKDGQNGKENVVVDADMEDLDELAVTTPPPVKGKGKKEKDIWDPPSSDEELHQSGRLRRPHSTSKPSSVVSTPKVVDTPKSKKGSVKKNRGTIGVVQEKPASAKRSGRKSGSAVKEPEEPVVKELHVQVPPRSPGRPSNASKAALLRKAKALSKQGRLANLATAGGEESDEDPQSARKRRSTRTKDTSDAELEIPDNQPEEITQPETEKRGRPRKGTDAVESGSNTPRGILTPSRGRPKGPRKSVAFQPEKEIDLGFKDIPTIVSTKKIKKSMVVEESPNTEAEPQIKEPEIAAESEASNDDEDTPCEVCSKRSFTKKNPILLCDGCDAGYHVRCCGLSGIPIEETWVCPQCEPAEDLVSAPVSEVASIPAVNTPDIEGFEDHLRYMQRIVLDKLTGQKKIKLRGFDEEMQKVHQVVEQTVLAGEGNSMLVIGARGCGKTTLVESVISDISENHRENFHVVRLNGFIQTDDKLALKEIWRQLGREMEIEDDHSTSNHADTLTTLLALLSHPSEMSDSSTDQTTKSVIFVLDEFDLFTTHPRQTLLYNLFDIAQARKAPIVVLGLTTRVDVVESLEKRVKSRFSHRYVHLSLPRSIPAYWEICKEGLLGDSEEFATENHSAKNPGQDQFIAFWQSMIEDLYSKDAIFKNHNQSEFYRTKSVPAFFASCILPIANLSLRNPILTGKAFTSTSMSLSAPDSKLQILQGLSELELALLIAAARLDIIQDTDTCNFAMAYDEYSSLTSRHKISTSSTGIAALGASAKVWGREVLLGAWEKLAEYELLVPAGFSWGGRDFGASGRMWKVDVGLEEIPGSVDGLSTVMTKWCREI